MSGNDETEIGLREAVITANTRFLSAKFQFRHVAADKPTGALSITSNTQAVRDAAALQLQAMRSLSAAMKQLNEFLRQEPSACAKPKAFAARE